MRWLIPLFLLAAPSAEARLLYQSDFETGRITESATSTADDTWYGGAGSPQSAHSYTVVQSDGSVRPRTGKYFLKMNIRNGDLKHGNYRNEIERRNVLRYGSEHWIGFSIYLPGKDWGGTSGGHAGYLSQIKGNEGTGFIFANIKAVDDPFSFSLCNGPRTPLPTDQWVDIAWRVKYANDGFVQAYVDGKLASGCDRVPYDTDQGNNGDSGYVSLRIGEYIHPWNGDMTVYFDAVKIGDAGSSLAEVSPGGSALPPERSVPTVPAGVRLQ